MVGTIVSTALLSVTAIVISTLLKNYFSLGAKLDESGRKHDLAAYLRPNIACDLTRTANLTICQSGALNPWVQVTDIYGAKIISKYSNDSTSQEYGNFNLRAKCIDSGNFTRLEIEYVVFEANSTTPVKSMFNNLREGWQDLYRGIHITCQSERPEEWYQANSQNCSTWCTSNDMQNATSPEGNTCVSGENRPASASDITFTYGTWGGGGAGNASSDSTYCYAPAQTKDYNVTDSTVGCYCK